MTGELGLFLQDSVAKGTLIARPTAVKLAPLNFGKTNVSDVSALLLFCCYCCLELVFFLHSQGLEEPED